MTADTMGSIVEAACDAMVSNGADSLFANGIANGLIALCATATVSVAVMSGSDTSPSGTFAGSGSGAAGCMPVGSCASSILAACNAMKADPTNKTYEYLAEQIAAAIDAVCKAATITISISGTTTLPPGSTPPTTPSSDSGTGKFSGDSSTIEGDLKQVFEDMGQLDEDHNQTTTYKDMCRVLADSVVSYLQDGKVACQGSTHLSGVTGNGTIS